MRGAPTPGGREKRGSRPPHRHVPPPPPPPKRIIRDRSLRNRIISVLQLLVVAALLVGLVYRFGWLSWVTGQ